MAILIVSVQQVMSLSTARTRLRDQIARDDAAADLAKLETVGLQKNINTKALKGLAVSTQQANRLIDERTFSWTIFFGLIEKTLPNDVRLVSVAPIVDKQGVLVLMSVVSKRTDDLAAFIEALQATGAFYDVLPRHEDSTEDGMRKASLEARYLPPRIEPAPAAPKTPKTPNPIDSPKAAPSTAKKGGGE